MSDPAANREYLELAHELADVADRLTLAAFRHSMQVRSKPDGTWVTEVDESVEATLRTMIEDRFPDHAVLGEESGRQGPEDSPTWIIDPIDGTTNFVKGNPIYATLIGVQVAGVEVAGVVSAPALTTRWDGIAGGKAHQDARVIQVSEVAQMSQAEIAFGGLQYFDQKGWGEAVGHLIRTSHRQRGYGDFWGHCLVASGSTEIAVDADASVWDLAAIKVIVEAAGGRFTDLRGRATSAGGDGLSTNGLLHEQVLKMFGPSLS